ncbi:hypothetical protein LZ30DRAFT_583648 [Colletotrichum cereale]|nr:hypothetical protein LZ30DRAFT_583648 [Colletotrichum cereale]
MDNIPLHHDIVTLPSDVGHRHGDFLIAIPSNRSMYRTTLLRAASLLVASIILSLVASAQQTDAGADVLAVGILNYAAPTAVPAWVWSAVDLAAHLLVWLVTMAFLGLLLAAWWSYARSDGWPTPPDPHRLNMTAALGFFMFEDEVEVDNNRRQYSDIIFLPRADLCETVPVPPSTPWELFSPTQLLLSYFANHYVRFVPGADGTVTVARHCSSRQARF